MKHSIITILSTSTEVRIYPIMEFFFIGVITFWLVFLYNLLQFHTFSIFL